MSDPEKISFTDSYHHGDLKTALVIAAAELVTCRGASAVSLREVARILGVSHNAPYRHFSTRQALLAAVAAYGFETLINEMEMAIRAEDPTENLRAIGWCYLTFALRQRGVYQLMFGGEIRKSDHPDLLAIGERAFTMLKQQVAPLAPALDARLATITAFALMHGIAHLLLDKQLENYESDHSEREELVTAATGVLTAGLSKVKLS